MSSNAALLEERKSRIRKAVALEKPDRVPCVPLGDAFAAKMTGVKISEFCTDPWLSTQTMIDAFTQLGEIDGIQHVQFNYNLLSLLWLSKIKVPGEELPENSLWQVEELELMKVEDYDIIIDRGYEEFINNYFMNQLDNLGARVQPAMENVPKAMAAWEELGIPAFSPGLFTIPFEMFCGGRSFNEFVKDLHRYPDKVEAAMDAAMPYILENARQACRGLNLMATWVGGWRSASEFFSPRLWQRFVLPYYKQLVDAVLEEGTIAVLHFDSDWTRDLEYLKEFPKGKCILSTDGETDLYKAKEVLGDHMCLMGDVPPGMLTLSNPDEVYEYSTKLVKDLGPSGFILAQGCDIPPDAKPENVKAMISAVHQ